MAAQFLPPNSLQLINQDVICVCIYKWLCFGIAREAWDSLCDLGFNKHINVKEADNSDPSIILHPPEHTSMHGPVLGTKGRSVF